MFNEGMRSSATDEWATPQDFFDRLNSEFHFTLDVCATPENAKCARYFTRAQDGLKQDWTGETVWCNPPYGRVIGNWVRRCCEFSAGGGIAVMLVPARTDTRWFHDWVYGKAEIRFVRGRLKFGDGANSAPFPSMVLVYRGVNDNVQD